MRENWDMGLISGSRRSPGGRHGNPLQYSCLENPLDRGAWRAIVHSAAKNWTRLKWLGMHAGIILETIPFLGFATLSLLNPPLLLSPHPFIGSFFLVHTFNIEVSQHSYLCLFSFDFLPIWGHFIFSHGFDYLLTMRDSWISITADFSLEF